MKPSRRMRTLLQTGRERHPAPPPAREIVYPGAGSQLAFARVATALAVVSTAAMAVGALAIGSLAIRSLRLRDGEIRSLRIGELEVGRLRVRELIREEGSWTDAVASPAPAGRGHARNVDVDA